MAKVSIVIPVYNVKRYLKECLDSVIHQTLTDIEIICVDDGSTDGSEDILDEYAGSDNRFRVIHKQNEGYGKAMNVGMDVATAPYIGIVESDDRIELDMYEKLYNKMEETGADVIKADFFQFYEEGNGNYIEEYKNIITGYEQQIKIGYNILFSIREYPEALLCVKYTWSGLYRSKFLKENHIKHNETPGASYQDNGFWFQTFVKSDKIFLWNKAFYHYRIDNPGASTRSDAKVFAVCDEFDFINSILEEMGERGKQFYGWSYFFRLKDCYHTINRVAEEYKLPLAQKMREDYWKAITQGQLDVNIFSDYWKIQMFKVLSCPEEYIKQEHEYRNQLEKQIEPYEMIVLYGAGKIGERVHSLLREGRIHTKVKCFAVTSMQENEPQKYGVPVKPIKELVEYKDKALVVISVGKNSAESVKEMLQKLDFKYVIEHRDLFKR